MRQTERCPSYHPPSTSTPLNPTHPPTTHPRHTHAFLSVLASFPALVVLSVKPAGANGAGKSSLLRVIGGKHFHHPDKVRVFGRPAFHDTSLSMEVAHLGDRWGYESHGDVSVKELIASIEGSDSERCQMLMDVLEVSPRPQKTRPPPHNILHRPPHRNS